MFQKSSPILVCLFLALLSIGCGGKSPDGQRFPVSGTVTLSGKPVENAQIVFVSQGTAKKVKASTIVTDGKFSFTSKNGPIEGINQVQVFSVGLELEQLMEENPKKVTAKSKILTTTIPKKFGAKSPIKVTVKAADQTEMKIELK